MIHATTPSDKTAQLAAILARAPVLPVVTLDSAEDAVPVARALVAGGIGAIEITLRTAAGLEAVRAIAADVPGLVVGAGTVVDVQHVDAARAAGARFIVSPGTAPALLDAAERSPLPWLPGVATASEVMQLMERGHRHFKFFPAAAAGGPAWLAALHGPLPLARFCPTGGVNATNAAAYLGLPNVACVGGSWLTRRECVARHAWGEIERVARAAVALGAACRSDTAGNARQAPP